MLEAEPWDERVTALGKHLTEGLHRLQKSSDDWGNIRGLGLMQGIEVVRDGKPDAARTGALIEAMLARGVILLSSGVGQNILSFTPPFVIEKSEIDFAPRANSSRSRSGDLTNAYFASFQ